MQLRPGNGTAGCHDHIHANRRHVCATRGGGEKRGGQKAKEEQVKVQMAKVKSQRSKGKDGIIEFCHLPFAI
jgi:hypothetical protein